MSKVVAFTPAGRRRYMQLLEPHILNDPSVAEWYVLDNCRDEDDRQWLHQHVVQLPKVRLFTKPDMQGTPAAIHAFYHDLKEPDAFYVKVDDDIVWMEPDFFGKFAASALGCGDAYTWFSPLVINNGICSWLVKYFTPINYPEKLYCMASCPVGWYDPGFAAFVHDVFLKLQARGGLGLYRTPNKPVMLSRFSINCIGFWGRERLAFGDSFAPVGECDEEWISAVWPAKTGRPGLILGDRLVSHFSFFTQEEHLLQTDLLERYYALKGLTLCPEILESAREAAMKRISPFVS